MAEEVCKLWERISDENRSSITVSPAEDFLLSSQLPRYWFLPKQLRCSGGKMERRFMMVWTKERSSPTTMGPSR
ncbi:hypothetical protein CHARACLAT_031123 [Characodon lateralis]|uniref:Uncharacterized protein n=1 Tax=Characodon lateralis TaxID=208331 RepID=A0ABU7DC22_9TELE|nr:hypothetical protein [Characodon lateralis]